MKIAIIGSGAIGSVVGAYLSEHHETTLIARKNQAQAINSKGLFVKGVRGEKLFRLKAKEVMDEEPEIAVVCTKTQDVEIALKENLEFLKNSLVLTSQNGVRADKIAAQLLRKENLLSSIVMFGATFLEPGEVVHNFEGDWILGDFFSDKPQKLKAAKEALKSSFNIIESANIAGMKWTKVFVNFNNCLPALLGKSMQEAFSDVEISKLSIRLLKEGFETVDKAGVSLVSLPNFDIDKFRSLTQMPLEKAAGIFSGIMKGLSKEPLYGSIYQSIKRKRPSEIDYINGEVVNLAAENNLPAPLNKKIVAMVKQVEDTKQFLTKEEIINGTSD